MKKIIRWLAVSMLLGCWLGSARAFQNSFPEAPAIDWISSKALEEGKNRFDIQHHFQNWDIESMNLRLGHGITDRLEVDAQVLYHFNKIEFTPEAAEVSQVEYGFYPLYAILSEYNGQPLDVALTAGFDGQKFQEKFIDREVDQVDNYVSGRVMLGKGLTNFAFVQASPLWLYHTQDSTSVMGMGLSAKLYLNDLVALVGEYPLLLTNPYHWKNPWSIGVQFHLGPHMWTLFFSNTFGFTDASLLQGTDRTYFGFRFSF